MRLLAVTGFASTLALAVAVYVWLTGAWAYFDDEEQARLEADRDRMLAVIGTLEDPVHVAKVRLQILLTERHIARLKEAA